MGFSDTKSDTNELMVGRKEGNVLFNDVLNTFYLRLYGVGHLVKDHSDSESGNPLPPHGLLFPMSSKVFLYASSHRNSSMGRKIDPTTHLTMSGRSTTELHFAPE